MEIDEIRIEDVAGLVRAVLATSSAPDVERMAGRTDTRVLVDALGWEDARARRSAIALVPYTGDPAPFLPALIEIAASRDRDLASRAAWAAAESASRLDSRDSGPCTDGQCGLVEIRGPMLDAFGKVLGEDGVGPDILRSILSILAMEAGRGYVPDLRREIRDLLDHPDPRVRTSAASVMTPPLDQDMLEAILDASSGEEDPGVAAALLLSACAAVGQPDGQGAEADFRESVERLASELHPSPAQAAPLASCLSGLGKDWAADVSRSIAPAGQQAGAAP